MLREAEKESNFKKLEIIDPKDTVLCVYCKQPMSKKETGCIMIRNNTYAHSTCQAIENKREKTDKEKLEDYIQQLLNIEYIGPNIRKQINTFVNEYNYTYSGIHKALVYHYEIQKNDISKANGGIMIVPYVYQKAYNYYYNLWLAQQKNKDIEINLYKPKEKEIIIPPPQRKTKMRKLFTFLDEEINNGK